VTVELARGTVPRPARSGPGDGPSVSATQVGSIGGRPVTQETLTEGESVERAVRWSPVDGLEARVSGDYLSLADLMRMASLIRLDQAVRCTVPLRLTALPAGTSATGCTMDLPGTAVEAPFVSAELTLGGSGSMIVNFDRQVYPAASSNVKPSITLPGGVQAGEIPPVDGIQGPGVAIFDLDGRRVQVTSKEGYGADDVLLVAKGLRRAGEPAQADTWPERPVS